MLIILSEFYQIISYRLFQKSIFVSNKQNVGTFFYLLTGHLNNSGLCSVLT